MIFECMVKGCDHDYSLEETLFDEDGRNCGSSLKCAKCGVLAIYEDMWGE